MRVPLKAGKHVIIVTFPESRGLSEGPVPNLAGNGGMGLAGPVDARGSAARPTLMFMVDGKKLRDFEIGGADPGRSGQHRSRAADPGAGRDHGAV